MKTALKKFVLQNKPARLLGGFFDGRDIFIPANHEGPLKVPIRGAVVAGEYDHLAFTGAETIRVVTYLPTKNPYYWQAA